ncbi:hypothetical protein J1792_31690 [Streptomyces triculaminicus]|uniref:Uncharacterized protein n=2 Tax=Streptomyces TaxID=1883 RepID=A0A939FUP1_9ACTN|nr:MULTISPECIES: hypothetical protein [Streptomyces]MBO0657124.1 hypothetical protein [Streptomyces triculaminicus]QSY49488.1 hypothetical protein J3S04_32095 [Streptomyces griseocarneus]
MEEKWRATETGESDDGYKQHDGVYVRWELPDALRRGTAREPGGRTEFPLVPNRWLVVRHVQGSPELTTGWVVESDCLDPKNGTSRFIHPVRPDVQDPAATPYRSTITTTKIGRAHGIGPGGAAWSEPAGTSEARKELFLTAVGPGIMTFHAYQPYHPNVFSLHDPLTGVQGQADLDYQIVGWYSDPAQEELRRRLGAAGATVDTVLAGLGWTVDDLPPGWTPGSTTYCGRAIGVRWTSGTLPESDRPGKNDVRDKIAVGSSADEAHAQLLAASGHDALAATDPTLLHAAGSGLLDTLDGPDGPDGPVRTGQALHKSWYRRLPGGTLWRLADTTDKGNASGDPKSVTWTGADPEHEEWLARLNGAQSAYDEKQRDVTALQQRLYALWWMHGLPLIPRQYAREQFRAEIDPANPDGLAARVAGELADLRRLQEAVTALVDGHTLPAHYELRKETLPPRLLQPARLRFDFVDEHDDTRLVDLTAHTTPVGAWIVPNYVDRSLLCYAPTGEPLGELRLELREDPTGSVSEVVGWGPLPDSATRTIDELRTMRPQLHAFARELAAEGRDAFTDLMATVDRALAGIDPGNPYGDEVLGALLGRPLALVRARLGFELDGLPVSDAGWQYALDWKTSTEWRTRPAGRPTPPQIAHLDYRWPIRLGNAGQQGDGLIGYFTENARSTPSRRRARPPAPTTSP